MAVLGAKGFIYTQTETQITEGVNRETKGFLRVSAHSSN